jgi:precorrin-2 dehydrogenase/sirohydrochlorin ferrochelatase
MQYYPIFLDIRKKPCLVIGGGKVAERKIKGLLKAGARVTVMSPVVTKEIKALAKAKKLRHEPQSLTSRDKTKLAALIDKAFLVISATNSEKVNKRVVDEARRAGKPVNVVDSPKLCSFIAPSVVERGPLLIALSTSGRFPMLAKTLGQNLDENLPAEYGDFVEILGAARDKLLKEGAKSDKIKDVCLAMLHPHLLQWTREGSRQKINMFLKGLLGEGYTLSKLKVRLK